MSRLGIWQQKYEYSIVQINNQTKENGT